MAKIFASKKVEEVDKITFILWVGLLGPKNSYRELALQHVDEDVEMFSIYAFRLRISGSIFLKCISAIEVDERVFIDKDCANEEDWKEFLERVLDKELPRVLLNKEFRDEYGLPNTVAEYEARVIDIITKKS